MIIFEVSIRFELKICFSIVKTIILRYYATNYEIKQKWKTKVQGDY